MMGCVHGNAIAECPDARCRGNMNDPADDIADRAANVWNEVQRLRHELEFARKELAAAVELHERAGTMIAEALGRHALTHQVGWLYEDYAADIRAIVDREERVAVGNAVLQKQRDVLQAHVDSLTSGRKNGHCNDTKRACCVRRGNRCMCECAKCVNARAAALIPDEPPGEEMGKILTAFAGTVVTISVQCACCNERLSTTGVAGEKLDAELEHFRRSESWERLPRRESNPVRPHPVDICWVCVNEINPDLDPLNEIGRLRHELAIARSERDLALGNGEAIRIHNDVVKERDAMHAELVAERERTDALATAVKRQGAPWPKEVGAALQAIVDARGWRREP